MAGALKFHPRRPSLREVAPVAFLSLLWLVLAPRILASPTRTSLLGLAAFTLLVACGIWLQARLRFPGSPTLRVDGEGMCYIRGGRERRLAWKDVAEIQINYPRREFRFVPSSGGHPIVMHSHMVTADGRWFDSLIEEYWQPPTGAD